MNLKPLVHLISVSTLKHLSTHLLQRSFGMCLVSLPVSKLVLLLSSVYHHWSINMFPQPFTSYFPQADIHKLLTPNLLHQLIKGTFKDHLVEWVIEYIWLTAETEDEATQIIEQIDRQ